MEDVRQIAARFSCCVRAEAAIVVLDGPLGTDARRARGRDAGAALERQRSCSMRTAATVRAIHRDYARGRRDGAHGEHVPHQTEAARAPPGPS